MTSLKKIWFQYCDLSEVEPFKLAQLKAKMVATCSSKLGNGGATALIARSMRMPWTNLNH